MGRGIAIIAGIFVACGARSELDVPPLTEPEAGNEAGDVVCVPTSSVHLDVPDTVPWTDTGVSVVAGTKLVVTASGIVRYGPMTTQVTDPNGGNFDGTQFFADSVIPSAVTVSLIGKIGGSAAVGTGMPVPEGVPGKGAGFVGTTYSRIVPTSGRLFLGYNDQVGEFGDNSGSFSVTIAVSSCTDD